MKNLYTGRVVLEKSKQEANRKVILDFMKDTLAVNKIMKSTVTGKLTSKGQAELKGTLFNDQEGPIVVKALKTWWEGRSEEKQLLATYLTIRSNGKLSSGLESLDEKIDQVLQSYLPVADNMNTLLQKNPSCDVKGGVFARVQGGRLAIKYTSRGVNRWTNLVNYFGLEKGQIMDLLISDETVSMAGVHLYNRVLFGTQGEVYQFRLEGKTYSPAEDFTRPASMLDSMMFAKLAGLEESTMTATPTMHFGATVGYKKGDYNTKVVVSKSPWYMLIEGPWGVTNSGKLAEGYANTFREVPGWLQLNPLTKEMESLEAWAKLVARIEKLDKEASDEMKYEVGINNVFVLNEVEGKGAKFIKEALCTGVIWTPADVLIQHGQCRVVSTAKKLGIKGTLAPVAFVIPEFEARGITLLSFGSAKGGAFGVQQTGATPVEFKANSNGGHVTMKGFFLPSIDVVKTNHYLIQSYMPACLTTLINTWSEAANLAADQALSKIEPRKDNPAMVDMVLDTSVSYNISTVAALQKLSEEGVLVRKGTTTSWTPTEFDTMSTYFGRDCAKALIKDLVKNPLNKGKKDEYKIIGEYLSGNIPAHDVRFIHINELFGMAKDALEKAGCSVSALKSKAPSRALLVYLVDAMYGVNEVECDKRYIGLYFNQELVVYIPTGKFLEGATFKSSALLDNVVMSGFIAQLLPLLSMGVNSLVQEPTKEVHVNIQAQAILNIRNIYESMLMGKKAGRLNCVGGYHVLSVAPWADNKHTVYAPNAERYKKGSNGSHVVVTKHPAVFCESHTGAIVESSFDFYKDLVGGCMSDEKLTKVLEALGDTVFVHPDMLLALQNDSDGDQARLSWHDGIQIPLFQGKILEDSYITSKFHQKYKDGELDFEGKGTKAFEFKSLTKKELLKGCEAGKIGKDAVSRYTANSQKFAQLFGNNPSIRGYADKQAILGMWIQEFAMNTIKHQQKGGNTISDVFYRTLGKDDDFAEFKKVALQAFDKFAKDFEIVVPYASFAEELFMEVRQAISSDRSVVVQALSRDRDVQAVAENSLFGAGLKLDLDSGTLMDFLVYTVLAS